MKLSQMEYFLAVAEELNFTAAAKSLYISQPALSKQIALLEEELDTKLFIRNSRKVALTAAGKQFEQDLKEILEQLEQAKRKAIKIGKTEKLHFRIGCFDGAMTEDFLPAVFEHIRSLVPDSHISLFRGSFQENRKALERDEIDLLLTLSLDFSYDREYCTKNLIYRKGALIYSTNSPVNQKANPTIADFAAEPYLILKQSLAPELHSNSLENLRKLGFTHPDIVEVENFATLSAYLELGHGFTILTADAAAKSPHLKAIMLGEEFGTWIVAVWKKNHPIAELLMEQFTL